MVEGKKPNGKSRLRIITFMPTKKELKKFFCYLLAASCVSVSLWAIMEIKRIHEYPYWVIEGLQTLAILVTFLTAFASLIFIGWLTATLLKDWPPNPLFKAVPFVIPIIIVISFLIALRINTVREDNNNVVSKSAVFMSALDPAIKALLPQLVTSPKKYPAGQLARPYVMVYLGGLDATSDISRFGNVGVLNMDNYYGLSVTDMKTIIVIEDKIIDTQTYTGTKGTFEYDSYHYAMWAFDIKTGNLGAFTTFDDPRGAEFYNNSEPQQVPYRNFLIWADSITTPQ